MSAWTDPPTLEGGHVTLRPLEPEDRDALLSASADGRLWELFYTVAPGPDTIDYWLQNAFRERSEGRGMAFAVLDAGGSVVGTTRYLRMNRANRRVEIGGTFYAARAQRTGLNTEAKLLLLGYAFEVLDCVCVQFRTDWFNKPSQRAIERLGAKLDGVLRGQRIMPDGRVRDTMTYSVLEQEWPGVKLNLETMLARGSRKT
ncbi:GNAT family N-acetyltransferase [Sphingomonas sp. MG17]|jgi:RimJ/RimL family protein N-acetyltransferase|uniref:GNAT family N-acetyltransferase n=1 Tax=Sphingomonas tagetis TaxID=2949092 RepID=A0A9X2KJV9_9SPHN|nr:GNAT family protein [Sphingomonas tagetis]MCP3728982.1 GNAT family N-acetyltransferase [Sphingomonas tagetis]